MDLWIEASIPPDDLVPEDWREALARDDALDEAMDAALGDIVSVDDVWEMGAHDA